MMKDCKRRSALLSGHEKSWESEVIIENLYKTKPSHFAVLGFEVKDITVLRENISKTMLA